MPSIPLADIIDGLGRQVIRVLGPTESVITGPAPLHAAPTANCVAFCSAQGEAAVAAIRSTNARAVLCLDDVATRAKAYIGRDHTLISVENPRLAFIRVAARHFATDRPTGIDSTAVISPTAQIGSNVHIGAFSYIGGGCSVGDGTVIRGRVHLYPGSIVGRNVIIHAGAVIGADGFGFERNERGRWEKFPHFGCVVVEDDVEIGANVCIDRAAMGETRIGTGAKIDDLVYIAHNVTVGPGALIMAGSAVAGNVSVGEDAELAPGAIVRNNCKIGHGARVGMGAVVVKDVPPNLTVIGVPARAFEKKDVT